MRFPFKTRENHLNRGFQTTPHKLARRLHSLSVSKEMMGTSFCQVACLPTLLDYASLSVFFDDEQRRALAIEAKSERKKQMTDRLNVKF